jgi:hypothetical protein
MRRTFAFKILVGLQEGGLKQTYWEMVGKINA